VTRLCEFCGEEIATNAPPEHVMPKWLRKFTAKGEMFENRPGTLRSISPESDVTATWGVVPQKPSKHPQITVDTVCADCNHDWMSDLEAQASPILTPMIEGKRVGLSVEQQLLLSRWIVKTAMTWGLLIPKRDRAFPPESYRWLKERNTPPPDVTIRLARYTGDASDFIDMKHESLFIAALPKSEGLDRVEADGYRVPLVIGQLVIEVTVSRKENNLLRPVGPNSSLIADLFVTIWPSVNTVVWPSRYAMSDSTLESFMDPERPKDAT
jgi:hypothetical protein